MMLVEARVLHCNDCIYEIARNLVVRNRLPIFHVDLPKDFAVSIEDYTGRFHLLHLVQIECSRLIFEIGDVHGEVDSEPAEDESDHRDRHVEFRPFVPRLAEVKSRRRSEERRVGKEWRYRSWT